MPDSLTPRSFPATRMRRNRTQESIRRFIRENTLSPNDFIYPLFVTAGKNIKQAIPSMPNIYRYSIDLLLHEAKESYKLGIPAIALFPCIDPNLKNETASEALNPDNLICRALRALKEAVPELMVVCDVALDPYTTHGHDGLLNKNGEIDNDLSLPILTKQALLQARAGCDTLAPSDMMDGRVGVIRSALEAESFVNTRIMSYAAKYASAFYGPFRDAVGSTGNLTSHKKTYQIDPANSDEALHEIALDIAEGADLIIVKPAMPYLDIIARASQKFSVPIIAYQVSGEYSMLKNAQNPAIISETLLACKRAGAVGIITYFAKEICAQF